MLSKKLIERKKNSDIDVADISLVHYSLSAVYFTDKNTIYIRLEFSVFVLDSTIHQYRRIQVKHGKVAHGHMLWNI